MTSKQKQWQLRYLGYYTGEVDGKFGPLSKEATEAFQRDNGLDDDGIFGSKTKAMSKSVIKEIQKAIGMTAKQQDGLAGKKTEAATKVFQAANGLSSDGIAGPLTRAKIEELKVDFWLTIKHFKREDFKCKCGGKYCNGYPAEMNREVVQVADAAVDHFGVADTFNPKKHMVSGLRCPTHNKNEKGATKSRHMYGRAIDLKLPDVTSKQLLSFVKSQGASYAYRINSTNVHFDVQY